QVGPFAGGAAIIAVAIAMVLCNREAYRYAEYQIRELVATIAFHQVERTESVRAALEALGATADYFKQHPTDNPLAWNDPAYRETMRRLDDARSRIAEVEKLLTMPSARIKALEAELAALKDKDKSAAG
ncbi:MAG TPA: hypothetical protein VFF06_34900, partial [Polyangia bacterium]|nr:hypothetical protein [Polyangia bacterium]